MGLVAGDGAEVLNLSYDGLSGKNFAEYNVLVVEVGGGDGGYEELGAVGTCVGQPRQSSFMKRARGGNGNCPVTRSGATGSEERRTRTGICHGQQERLLVLELEVLILELLAVDTLAAGAVAIGEVAALDHELLDYAVEVGALVVQGLATLGEALLAGAEGAEVLGRLGHDVVVKLHNDTAGLAVADRDLKEDAAALHGSGG